MQWVTYEHVHLDRVASPWLIKRFVDHDAEFVFVPWRTQRLPPGAIPLALPGAELGPHDASGTTFDKIVAKYELTEPAIVRLAGVVRAGVAHFLHGTRPQPADEDGQIAIGLLAIAEGMALVHQDDGAILEASYIVYDALHAQFRLHDRMAQRGVAPPAPDPALGPAPYFAFVRGIYNGD
jgi:hypothetical protein